MAVLMISLFKSKPLKMYKVSLVLELVNGFTGSKTFQIEASDSEDAYRKFCEKVYTILDQQSYILVDNKMYAVRHILSWNLHDVKEA